MMRQPSSTYAGPVQQILDAERASRARLTEDRLARQQRIASALAETSAEAIATYRAERDRAARQGKPTLARIDEYRGASA